jgi:hypothetical protein
MKPSSGSKAPPGSAGRSASARKAASKVRRSYNNVTGLHSAGMDIILDAGAHGSISGGGGAENHDHGNSNMSYETNSSGNSNSGLGSSRHSAPAVMPSTFSTPAMVSEMRVVHVACCIIRYLSFPPRLTEWTRTAVVAAACLCLIFLSSFHAAVGVFDLSAYLSFPIRTLTHS